MGSNWYGWRIRNTDQWHNGKIYTKFPKVCQVSKGKSKFSYLAVNKAINQI